jgi:hypothetical protein
MQEEMAEKEEITESVSEELDPVIIEKISMLEKNLSIFDINITSFLGEININLDKTNLVDVLTILKNSPDTQCNLFLCLSIVEINQ